MKYVIMVSHGELASGLHSALTMMCGERDDVLSTSLKADMSADEFAENFKNLVSKFSTSDEIILLADILSGSPFTNAVRIIDEKGMMGNSIVIAGMNMPAALTAILMKDNIDDLESLKETILSEGHTGLMEFKAQSDESEDDI